MWLLLAAGCLVVQPSEDRVRGVDVVTVRTDPTRVSAFEPVEVTAWVVNSAGVGADVLIWPCTPVALDDERVRCVEGLDLLGDGMPVSTWSELIATDGTEATARIMPPLQTWFAVQDRDPALLLDEEGVPVPVFVFACQPGVCPIFDWWRADPLPGTEAYARLARTMAEPDLLTAQAERDQLSVTVKLFWLVAPEVDRRQVPELVPLGRRVFDRPDELYRVRWQWQLVPGRIQGEPDFAEPAAVSWDTRVRFTRGVAADVTLTDDLLQVDWVGDWRPESAGQLVVSVLDEAGGVAAAAVETPEHP